jgi:hypothetical protein
LVMPARPIFTALTSFYPAPVPSTPSPHKLWRVARPVIELQPSAGGLHERLAGLGPVGGMPIDHEIDGPGRVVQQPFAEVDEPGGGKPAGVGRNRKDPSGATAEIMLTEWRAPVDLTTGVLPTGVQVVPAW